MFSQKCKTKPTPSHRHTVTQWFPNSWLEPTNGISLFFFKVMRLTRPALYPTQIGTALEPPRDRSQPPRWACSDLCPLYSRCKSEQAARPKQGLRSTAPALQHRHKCLCRRCAPCAGTHMLYGTCATALGQHKPLASDLGRAWIAPPSRCLRQQIGGDPLPSTHSPPLLLLPPPGLEMERGLEKLLPTNHPPLLHPSAPKPSSFSNRRNGGKNRGWHITR